MPSPDLRGLPVNIDGTRWHVYSHRDMNGALLYIGCSSNLRARQAQHRRTAAWWPEVARVDLLSTHSVKRDALDTERRLIAAMDPPHNLLRTPREQAFYQAVAQRRFRPTRASLEHDVDAARRALARAEERLATLDSAGAA